jgi:hypothetical protein
VNQHELTLMRNLHKRELEKLERIQVSCKTCEQRGPNFLCKRFEATVPEDVRLIGCEHWQYDPIPF